MSVADFIDNSPMGKLFTAVVMEGPGKALGFLGKAFDKSLEITESAMAGVSGLIQGVGEKASGFSMERESAAAETVKLGLNAKKQAAIDVSSPYHADHNDIQAPILAFNQDKQVDIGRMA
jgi:hypothetical protein